MLEHVVLTRATQFVVVAVSQVSLVGGLAVLGVLDVEPNPM